MTGVKFSGPLFDGQAEQAVKDGVRAARQAVAAQGERLVRAVFSSVIRQNHGRFLNSVTSTEQSRTYSAGGYSMAVTVGLDEDIVTTDLATYGPWLEGTGSRNETTRFKGYHGFRQAAQELNFSAQEIADQALRPYVEALNG